jgi:hypothetical protein
MMDERTYREYRVFVRGIDLGTLWATSHIQALDSARIALLGRVSRRDVEVVEETGSEGIRFQRRAP